MPVFGTIASTFNDPGVTALYQRLLGRASPSKTWRALGQPPPPASPALHPGQTVIVPPERARYLAEIAETRARLPRPDPEQAASVRRVGRSKNTPRRPGRGLAKRRRLGGALDELRAEVHRRKKATPTETRPLLGPVAAVAASLRRAANMSTRCATTNLADAADPRSLPGSEIPKVGLPAYAGPGRGLRLCARRTCPGCFPYTAGVFPFKREGEDPTRMFAGEGDPVPHQPALPAPVRRASRATRLSTAFDSVTLYGWDPDERPDIYGKVGNSGVSIATLDDMKALYDGFDLCAPTTSVSMTINGPAPIILALFLNTAIDQQLDKFEAAERPGARPRTSAEITAMVLSNVRGTVQADILKEDQGQNTCIFSTEFALRMMGDIQEYFIDQPGAQLLLGVDLRLPHRRGRGEPDHPARLHPGQRLHLRGVLPGPRHDDRRLRAQPVVLLLQRHGPRVHRDRPGGPAHLGAWPCGTGTAPTSAAQKLKYHIQTSGRSLHAQEMPFNDIRTTLQALCAIYDNCNSLHTNAYDEAITTPTEEIGAPGDGDPADHQPRVGPGQEREPAAGLLHRRAS